eukprot:UN06788
MLNIKILSLVAVLYMEYTIQQLRYIRKFYNLSERAETLYNKR